ncbi:hypothetical protein H310_14688 [Aphanomyces invadans]|uniref:Uncharacterized protein n=1 Tax=Aphanomyces invadans TaxID=157072 RepID=A0A024T953_9STRA|nr:hypothetical protein H310_14688 [Aphanomyces invadans]ETV90563.1 hypothetical protein H310_14688 [Aphanomyces invadans]|eukprot:XP_008880813.1 hypothetical protein H310_14688 [Aphanomyces invadans]
MDLKPSTPDVNAETAPEDPPASTAPRLSLPPSSQQEPTTEVPQQVNDISVKATSDGSSMSASMIIMVSCIGMAGVVAMALVVVVYRKLNRGRERKDVHRPGSIVVLGEHGTIHTAFDSTRCLQVL